MKKFCFLFCALTAATISFAQTVPGGDMETWRDATSGSIAAVPIHAPQYWFGMDSLIIADGENFSAFLGPGTHTWYTQIFEENTVIHGGAHSAKLMTLKQDTLGYFPGILSNAQASINVLAVIAGGSPTGAISYSGGTSVTLRIMTVSAYVEYYPGIDTSTHMMGGMDTALLTVEAHSMVHGADSIVGAGVVLIPPGSSFTQVTANVIYTDTIDLVDTVRILFFSSGGATQTLDSSTLYVDDITMTGVPQYSHAGVKNVSSGNNLVKVYPNPATNTIYLDGPQNAGLTCTLISVNGQHVATKALTGNDAIDVSDLSGGTYFYTITDNSGKTVQRGNVTVNR